MKRNTIELGDAYELIKEVPDKSVDLIMTDPPYDFGGDIGRPTGMLRGRDMAKSSYANIRESRIDRGIDNSILDQFVRVMKRVNAYIWCNKEQIAGYLDFFVSRHGCNFEIIVWGKSNPPPFFSTHYMKDKEYCLYFWESGATLHPTYETGRTVYTTMVNKEDLERYGHPTIKPVDIVRTLIENSTDPGDLVLDPFMGSGTTAAAARMAGRDFYGFEIEERFHKIATARADGAQMIVKNKNGEQYEQMGLF